MMETLAVYLLKSCALIALFYLGYFFLLRKETFFKSNRWFLLFGLVTSVMLPLITIKKIIWIEPLPAHLDWSGGPLLMYPVAKEGFEIDWAIVIAVLYAIGLCAFLLNFLLDFYSLRKALKGKTIRQSDYSFVDTDKNIAPFSYFNYIVYNSSFYSEAELANIIEHEKVHSNQNHTMDVLFARAFCIVFWFNPFMWLYKKAMLQNLEFIADNEAVKAIEDKKSYQITLLKVTAHENCVDITNHFYQSLIKKRIVMLNKNQSKKSNSWKYFIIVPALAAFMLYFQVKVVAQEKAITEEMVRKGAEMVIDKNSSDAQLKREAERIKKEHGVTLKFSKVKRNNRGEITCIKATYKDESGKKGTTQISGDEPIQPFRFYKNDNGAIGFGTGRKSNDRVRVVGVGKNIAAVPEDDFVFSFDDLDIEIPELPEMPKIDLKELPELPEMPRIQMMTGGKSLVISDSDGQKTVIVDGKVLTGEEAEKAIADIGPIIVNGEDILKKGGSYTYSFSGDDGSAVIVDTRKITKDAMEKARKAMEDAGPKMEKARAKMEKRMAEMDARRESRSSRNEDMAKAREEMNKAREEMNKAKEEMEKARAELKAEIEKQKAKSKSKK